MKNSVLRTRISIHVGKERAPRVRAGMKMLGVSGFDVFKAGLAANGLRIEDFIVKPPAAAASTNKETIQLPLDGSHCFGDVNMEGSKAAS